MDVWKFWKCENYSTYSSEESTDWLDSFSFDFSCSKSNFFSTIYFSDPESSFDYFRTESGTCRLVL